MTKVIEPPVLMSRILTFMLAASIVVLASLGITLFKMLPLERPEVFFLLNPAISTNVVIEPLVPDATNIEAIENYEEGFIRQYIIARNTLNANASVTRTNWTKIVKPWSSNKVFADFKKTALYQAYNFSEQTPNLSCSVYFPSSNRNKAIIRTRTVSTSDNEYTVNFTWICENIGGQTTQKNYKIRLRIQSDLDKKVSGTVENLEKLSVNPLGIQVTEYTVLDNTGDPLDSDKRSW